MKTFDKKKKFQKQNQRNLNFLHEKEKKKFIIIDTKFHKEVRKIWSFLVCTFLSCMTRPQLISRKQISMKRKLKTQQFALERKIIFMIRIYCFSTIKQHEI